MLSNIIIGVLAPVCSRRLVNICWINGRRGEREEGREDGRNEGTKEGKKALVFSSCELFQYLK